MSALSPKADKPAVEVDVRQVPDAEAKSRMAADIKPNCYACLQHDIMQTPTWRVEYICAVGLG